MKRLDVHVRGLDETVWKWLRISATKRGDSVARVIEDLVFQKVGSGEIERMRNAAD